MLRSPIASYVVLLVFVTAVRAGDVIPPEAGLPVIDWKDAGRHVDEQVIVQGRIVATRNIGRLCFLNFDRDRTFTALVREPSYKNFPQPPEELYDGKIVRIRGVISEYNGKPQIEVAKPDQVTLLAEEPSLPPPPAKPRPRPFDGTITLAAYNVLNLFDDYDDPYASDEGTEPKPKDQLEHLAATIHQIDADVLCLEEVENRGILERFVAAYLSDLGYQEVVEFSGNDRRGIECGVLSRFPVGPVVSHRHLLFSDESGGQTRFKRDLLKVEIRPPGCKPFFVFPVHFKSKRSGAETTEKTRAAECRMARRILDDCLKADPEGQFVICGDFNDTFDSAPLKILRGSGPTALKDFMAELDKKAVTYNQGEYRSVIDFILASPALGTKYVPKSYHVIDGSIETSGSDHNPIIARFKLK